MTVSTQPIIGHEQQLEMFRRATGRQRLGHAYLLTGTAGIGKRTFALYLAQALMCQQRAADELSACGECPGCRQVLSRTHPDLFTVGLPEGKTELPIEVFVGVAERRGREGLCHDLSLSPMHGGYRIAIIDDADRMNAASANALLKTLEEPGPGSILILIAVDADQVISTIRSRCQQVNFGDLTDEELRQVASRLVESGEEEDVDEQKLERAISLSGGSVSRMREALARQKIGDDTGVSQMTRILAQGRFRAVDLANAGETVMSEAKSDPTSQRDAAMSVIEACLHHFHQQLVSQPDLAEENPQLSDACLDALDRCFEAGRQIDRRINVPICLDQFYHDLEKRLRPTWK